jgi:hypothetical protein
MAMIDLKQSTPRRTVFVREGLNGAIANVHSMKTNSDDDTTPQRTNLEQRGTPLTIFMTQLLQVNDDDVVTTIIVDDNAVPVRAKKLSLRVKTDQVHQSDDVNLSPFQGGKAPPLSFRNIFARCHFFWIRRRRQ